MSLLNFCKNAHLTHVVGIFRQTKPASQNLHFILRLADDQHCRVLLCLLYFQLKVYQKIKKKKKKSLKIDASLQNIYATVTNLLLLHVQFILSFYNILFFGFLCHNCIKKNIFLEEITLKGVPVLC